VLSKWVLIGLLVLPLAYPANPAQEVQVAAAIAFAEGPTEDGAGNLFFTDQANNRIMRLAADGTLSTFRQPGNYANGLVFDAQWRLLACEGGDPAAGTPPRVTRTDLKTGRIEILADSYEGKRLRSPNDVTFDGRGRVYFTDKPAPGKAVRDDEVSSGGVYRIDPDGRLTRVLGGAETEAPNGLIISPDDRVFYLVEANPAERGARMIRAYDLRPDGTLAGARVFHNFYPGRSGDGMAVDVRGNLYVAAGLHRRRGTSETLDTKPGVHVFSPSGALLRYIPVPEDTVTNCAFGGADLKTLYVTAGKTVFKVRTEVEGTRR
jgi:gluconolactonase